MSLPSVNIQLAYDWDVLDFAEEERDRPQFRGTTKRKNPITGKEEKHYPAAQRSVKQVGSFSTMIFMLTIVIIIVVSVIVYRIAVRAALIVHVDPQNGETAVAVALRSLFRLRLPVLARVGACPCLCLQACTCVTCGSVFVCCTGLTLDSLLGLLALCTSAATITAVTAAILNLTGIITMNILYGKLAVRLTDWENHRKESEYEASLTTKIFLFSFVNSFASIFYIAFFKGKFVGRPGDYNTFFGYRQDEW